MADLVNLQRILVIPFNNLALLQQALVHSSYINENPGFVPDSNERLEFLGDAVLGLIVAERLYQDYAHFTEGKMTKLRAALVCRNTLARVAKSIGLGDHVYLGKGEEASGGRRKAANLASALEAVIGAIFLEGGYAVARNCVLRLLSEELQKTVNGGDVIDDKSRLQELLQAKERGVPSYQVIETTGPDHDKRFSVEVKLGDTVLGKGSGKSKKKAETEAARSALEQLSTSFTQ
ncbi:ribonuclease III [Chloroflexota bacterium]